MPELKPKLLPSQELVSLQREILELIATGQNLAVVTDRLCRLVEKIDPAVIPSILSVDRDGHLHPLAAPSLSGAYAEALDGTVIGPEVGSCGTAAYLGEPVEVWDIHTDPRWRNYRQLPLPEGVKACWSSPIKARDGRVIGTFAFYYRSQRGASDLDRQIVEACVHLCAIAIESDASRREMHRLAYHDTVTGLPNRVAFQEEMSRLLDEIDRSGGKVAVHYIDLDEFKGVNDTLGHRMGDLLLLSIALRLQKTLAGQAVVARLGGDEFAILQAAATPISATELASKTLGLFDEPFVVEDHHLSVGVSIGVALAPSDGRTRDELLKSADLALYRAKSEGRRRFRFYAPAFAEAANLRQAMAQDLRRALDRNEFSVVYQPIVSLAGGNIVACEALLRWRHPLRGDIPPSSFVSLAEEMGLIAQIGSWVLREACRQAATWPSAVKVSINLSPLQLRRPRLIDEVKAALSQFNLDPQRLVFEITETAILADDALTRDVLNAIKRMGVGFALDDFGTGYSSLWSLRTFPVDKIKIDKSFVQDLGTTAQARSIVRTMIALAESLGMTTTAEGVETEEQAARLQVDGCTEGQGHFFSRPVNAADIRLLLTRSAPYGEELPYERRVVNG